MGAGAPTRSGAPRRQDAPSLTPGHARAHDALRGGALRGGTPLIPATSTATTATATRRMLAACARRGPLSPAPQVWLAGEEGKCTKTHTLSLDAISPATVAQFQTRRRLALSASHSLDPNPVAPHPPPTGGRPASPRGFWNMKRGGARPGRASWGREGKGREGRPLF
eukprot:scaffold1304_cov215-Prasinococcus_capsulatus_cf.AAC.1